MKTVLITGGTSGIGLELTKLFVEDNYSVVVVSRSSSMPDGSPKVTYIQQDLGITGAATQVIKKLRAKKLRIDVLVNNAGVGDYSEFLESDIKRQTTMMQLNMISLTELTRLLLPEIVDRKGKILNLASTAAFAPGPFMSVYFASKHFVLAFSEALQQELIPKGVGVTVLCPGPTKTNFDEEAHANKSSLFSGKLATAADVALVGYRALNSGKVIAIVGWRYRFALWIAKFPSRSFIRKTMYRSLVK